MLIRRRVAKLLADRGLELRRHRAARRQQMLAMHGIDLVLDVGAAKGLYGAELRAFGYRGRIVSFEPQAASFSQLAARADADPDWVAVQCALGSSEGVDTLHVASNADSSSLLPMLDAHIEAAPSIRYVGTETIAVRCLDSVAPEFSQGRERMFLKMDTQGFERQVLAGGRRTVDTLVGLQIELSCVPIYEGGMTADEAIALVYGMGFVLVGFEEGFIAPTGQLIAADGVFFRQ